MSEGPKPPGLDDFARHMLRQGTHLAVGLLALPLVGLGLLAKGARRRAEPARPADGLQPDPPQDDAAPPPAPSKGGPLPRREEVEAALRALTTATLPRSRPKAKAKD